MRTLFSEPSPVLILLVLDKTSGVPKRSAKATRAENKTILIGSESD
jgi:hypothetical protein